MEKYTQDEAIRYELAQEIITMMMAIKTGQASREPDPEKRAEIIAERLALHRERKTLDLHDQEGLNAVIGKYAPIIRAWKENKELREAA